MCVFTQWFVHSVQKQTATATRLKKQAEECNSLNTDDNDESKRKLEKRMFF